MKWFLPTLLALTAIPLASGQSSFPALLARGPSHQYQSQLQLFGQFLGSWTFEGTEYHDDGSYITDKGEIHCHWVLQGRALQDVFRETHRSDRDPLLYGTTIRFYDPKIDAWRVTWINPAAGVVRTFIGRKSGNEIVMEGKAADGAAIRWIFSDIRQNAFHWHGEKLFGTEWRTYEELDARRE